MGAGEESSPAKHSKPAPVQETPPPSYADWSNSMQAYYGAGGTPPFFAPTVASPTPHPYMWGGQHPMMSPYGTPVPYPAMYPPAGVYAHPSMPMTPGTAPPNAEIEAKAYEGKERTTSKKSKGTSGNGNGIGVRTGETGKTASSSGNDGATQSAESGSDGSSDRSDENDQNEYSGGKKGSFNQMLADANAQNNPGPNVQTSVPGNPVVPMAPTNLNMGMDLWNPSAVGGTMKMRPNPSRPVVPPPMMGREGMMPDQWVQQDERELKRQKRKRSNRESARRSRLRKQFLKTKVFEDEAAMKMQEEDLKDARAKLALCLSELSEKKADLELERTLVAELTKKVQEGERERAGLITEVIPYACRALLDSDELGKLVGAVISLNMDVARASVLNVFCAKGVVDLSTRKDYRPDSLNKVEKAVQDYKDANFPFVERLSADPHASYHDLLLIKPEKKPVRPSSSRFTKSAPPPSQVDPTPEIPSAGDASAV